MERITKLDWLVIHEALCYVSINAKKFEKWLKEHSEPSALRHWKRGKKLYGHKLIGKTFRKT